MNEHDTRIDRWSLAGVGLWAMIGSLAIVLAVRAMGGAFDEPAPLLVPVLATLVSTALSLSSWTLFYWTGRTSDSGRRLFDGLLSMVPAGIIAYTTSMNSQPTTLAMVTVLLVGGLVFIAAQEGMRLSTSRAAGSNSSIESASAAEADAAHDFAVHGPQEAAAAAASPMQQITRRRDSSGGEQIEAVLNATFAPGEHRTAVHLPIHPVLSGSLHVEVEPLDERAVDVQTTEVRPFGIRLEVKRSADVDSFAELPIGVFVATHAARESAA